MFLHFSKSKIVYILLSILAIILLAVNIPRQVSAITTPTLITIKGTGVNEDTGSLSNNPSQMWVGTGSGTNSYSAIRFTSVNIPQGATINYANLQVSPTSNQWISMGFTMFMENSDNSQPFSSTSLPSQRIKTSAVPYASDENWLIGNYYTLSDYKTLLQGIVDRPGWTSGSAISLIGQGISSAWGRKNIVNSGSFSPQLSISYSLSSTSTPTPTTIISPTPTATISPTPTPTSTPTPNPSGCTNMTLHKPVGTDNPNYFYNSCNKPVYLTGSHTWGVMYDPLYIGTEANHSFYKILSDNNHNFMRLWQDDLFASLEGGYGTIDPRVERYVRTTVCCTSNTLNKFDLTQFNPAYNLHLRTLIEQARQKNIYVSIMFTNGWMISSGDSTNWDQAVWPYNYFYPGNSIQNRTGTTKDNVYTNSSPVNDLFKLHLANIVNTVKDLDNVMYEVINEAPGGNSWTFTLANNGNMDWQQDIANYVKTLDPNHPIGITTSISGTIQYNKYSWFTADWTSPAGDRNSDPAAKTDFSKVILLDTDHIYGEGGNDDWVWKAFTLGYNPIYMDNLQGSADALAARKAMGVTNYLANTRVQNLANLRPNTSPCTTTYCLGNGNEMLAYYPSGASNPNLGSNWQYDYYSTLSSTPLPSITGAKVIYARNISNPTPTPTTFPTPTPLPTVTPTPLPTVTPTPLPTISPTPTPTPGWTAQYFTNKTLSGTPALTRTDTTLNFNWGTSSPSSLITANNFSAKWTQTVYFAAGTYKFTSTYNDGIRLYVDGTQIINDWTTRSSAKTSSVTRVLSAGYHLLQLNYLENTGSAQVNLSWLQQ